MRSFIFITMMFVLGACQPMAPLDLSGGQNSGSQTPAPTPGAEPAPEIKDPETSPPEDTTPPESQNPEDPEKPETPPPEDTTPPNNPEEPGNPPMDPAPQPVAGDYYISTNGSDNNPGTKNLPFKTFQKALTAVAPGEIIVVRDGRYTTSGDIGVSITKRGQQNAWIRIVAENRGKAILDGQNKSLYGFTFLNSARYVSVEGFEVRGFLNGGVWSNSQSEHINIYGNTIHSMGKQCTDTQSGKVGIYIGPGSKHHTIDSNRFHSIGRLFPGEQGCQPQNQYWQNHDHAIYIRTGTVDIVNNIFEKMRGGWAIHAYDGEMDDVRVINNTFWGANPNRDGHIEMSSNSLKSWVIQNNIFEDHQSYAISLNTSCAKVTGLKVQGNIATGTLFPKAFTDRNCTMNSSSNREKSSAGLKSPNQGDFSITETSIACQVAVEAGSPEEDHFGRDRIQSKVCSGAYQPGE